MLKSKEELVEYLKKQFENKIVFDKDKTNVFVQKMNASGVPSGLTMDMLTGRSDLISETDFLLFLLTKSLQETLEKNNILSKYYTDVEIEMLSKEQWTQDKFQFPILIKCIRVGVDQWIGVTDVNFLMELRRAQLINYNKNAQRALQRVVKGEKSYYKISVNVGAVKQIKDSYHNGSFIPNTITLNMPEETTIYSYDSDKDVLTIQSLEHFDISDGYHRYLAICQEKTTNPDFNYPIELRIISFSDDKIKQFIYQEDQKTRMRKIDSDSMNMNLPANLVVERLNQDTMCNLHGRILRTTGAINFGELASVIDYYYFKSKRYSSSMADIIKLERELKTKFNNLSEEYISLLENEVPFIDLAIIIQEFSDNEKVNNSSIISMLERKQEIEKKLYQTKIPRKSLANAIKKLEVK